MPRPAPRRGRLLRGQARLQHAGAEAGEQKGEDALGVPLGADDGLRGGLTDGVGLDEAGHGGAQGGDGGLGVGDDELAAVHAVADDAGQMAATFGKVVVDDFARLFAGGVVGGEDLGVVADLAALGFGQR